MIKNGTIVIWDFGVEAVFFLKTGVTEVSFRAGGTELVDREELWNSYPAMKSARKEQWGLGAVLV